VNVHLNCSHMRHRQTVEAANSSPVEPMSKIMVSRLQNLAAYTLYAVSDVGLNAVAAVQNKIRDGSIWHVLLSVLCIRTSGATRSSAVSEMPRVLRVIEYFAKSLSVIGNGSLGTVSYSHGPNLYHFRYKARCWSKIAIFIPQLHSTPLGPRQNIATRFGTNKNAGMLYGHSTLRKSLRTCLLFMTQYADIIYTQPRFGRASRGKKTKDRSAKL